MDLSTIQEILELKGANLSPIDIYSITELCVKLNSFHGKSPLKNIKCPYCEQCVNTNVTYQSNKVEGKRVVVRGRFYTVFLTIINLLVTLTIGILIHYKYLKVRFVI